MGGQALKNIVTRRYRADEYYLLEKEVVNMVMGRLPHSFVTPIKAYNSKESFGDLDVLVSSDQEPVNFIEVIKELFNPRELVHNGNCISFDYKEFQVDFIVTKPDHYRSSCSYFAYNDLGNLLGRIAHSMGLKLGHDGLSYCWRVDTYQFKNIVLLTHWGDILPVLGLSYERYKAGFDTLEDIFEFVASSPFFVTDIYLLNNRNHTSRVRDAKRKTYMDFLTWIEKNNGFYRRNFDDGMFPLLEDYVPRTKANWLPYLFESIPGFKDIYNEVQKEWDEAVRFKAAFSGGKVMEWTGLQGKELGEFMKGYKDCEVFRLFVLRNTEEAVKELVTGHYNEWKGINGI